MITFRQPLIVAAQFVIFTLAMALIVNGKSTDAYSASDLQPLRHISEGALQVLDDEGAPIGQCPLQHTSVKAKTSGFAAEVEVTQVFTNPMDKPIEAIYVFPLPSDSTVGKMEMVIGQRTIRGVIKRREEAKEIYEEAKKAGKTAALLDQDRPNIFRQAVANILPGETIEIKITYVNLLKYTDGEFEFTFPMVVGPRYIPSAMKDTDDAKRISPPITPEGTRTGSTIDLEVLVDAGMAIGGVESVLHEIDTNRSGSSQIKVWLKDQKTIPNKDFVLRWKVATTDVRAGILPATRGAGEGHFALLLTPPKAPAASQIASREMIFIIDTSGSQMGFPLEKSKETMRKLIRQMRPGDTFNLMSFSNSVVPLFEKPVPNTAENRTFAEEFLTRCNSGGGTEMMNAVDAALNPPADPNRLRIVCFFTDGFVGNDTHILGVIRDKIGSARLFSFGIGNSVNRFLLDGMAEMGRGAVEYVTLAENGDKAVDSFVRKVSSPVLRDIKIDWGGLDVEEIYPQKIPDMFAGQPLIIKGRYFGQQAGLVTVKGILGNRRWQMKIPVSFPEETGENIVIPYIWAREKIAAMSGYGYPGVDNGKPSQSLIEDITNVALDYGIMSQYTSFVAVDDTPRTDGSKPVPVNVPVELPEGMSYYGIPSLGRVSIMAPSSSAPFYHSVTNSVGAPLASVPAVTDLVAGDSVGSSDRKLAPELKKLKSQLDSKGNLKGATNLQVKDGKVKVSLSLTAITPETKDVLKKMGFVEEQSLTSVNAVIGWLPLAKLDSLIQLKEVLHVRPVI